MRTLVSHFYNEEFLLPFWIDHHKNFFDNALLIDYGSTDSSLEIIQDRAPKNWKVVKTNNKNFDAFLVDHELMEYEKKIKGWKIALNTTEFLISSDLDKIESYCDKNNITGFFTESAVMVDNNPNIQLENNDLVTNKYFGFRESEFDFTKFNFDWYQVPSRNRIYHKNLTGKYHPGRHETFDTDINISKNSILILWYGFSPWNKNFLSRKLNIRNKISEKDISNRLGTQHLLDEGELNKIREKLLSISRDLRSDIKIYRDNNDFYIKKKNPEITNHIVLNRNHNYDITCKNNEIKQLNEEIKLLSEINIKMANEPIFNIIQNRIKSKFFSKD